MSQSGKSVLIAGPLVTRDDNADVAAVCAALVRRAARPVLFDTARPELSPALSIAIAPDATSGAAIAIGGTPLAQFSAVWRSGPLTFASPAGFTAEQARTTGASWEVALAGALEACEGLVVDPHALALAAENKPFQLHLAQGLGLEVPPTLISNEPAQVRVFAGKVGRVVFKLLVPQFLLRKPEGETGSELPVVWTQELSPGELASLRGLEACPMIFQQRIDKARDVRVAFVGDRLFPAAVDPNLVAHPHVDWRHDGVALKGHWRPQALPADVETKLHALRARLGLGYGAFDLIETPDGRHVFLEVNSFAVFSFIGARLAAPIAEALADLLVASPAGAHRG